MPHPRPGRLLRTTATAVASATLVAGVLATVPTTAQAAADERPSLGTVGKKLLTVQFDPLAATAVAGQDVTVSGTAAQVTQARLGLPGDGVGASFTLQVVDADGAVLGSQDVTAAEDGSFETTVPGSLTSAVDASTGTVSLALRAVDASSADGYAAEAAGATSFRLASKARGLLLENDFVSAVGWVKPGATYPSSIRVTNPTSRKQGPSTVVVSAPRGTSFVGHRGAGRASVTSSRVTWNVPGLKAGKAAVLVLESRASSLGALPTIVWRDLSTRASFVRGGRGTAVSHGPKVIPPGDQYDTARYGDRPFPVVPVQYTDRAYAAQHSGGDLEDVINSKKVPGSTFNLFQEMSLRQLHPHGTVPSAGLASADFDYGPGFPFQQTEPTTVNTCTGVTFGDLGESAYGSPLYPERITRGVYNLPGTTQWYGADANGSAIVGSLAGVAALQQIDSGCGFTGKITADAAALADPEIDYSDYDTDKDGVVDFFMAVFAGCGGNGSSQLGACSDEPTDLAPYDNIWPHSSSLEYYMSDPDTGLPGFVTDDQLKDLEGRKLFWTNKSYTKMTTRDTGLKVFVRVGPYNLNPETAIDKASVISHEYGHSLGLPDFYSTGGRETYGDWTLMATDKSQNIDAYGRQELGWVVPEVLAKGKRTTVRRWKDSKQDTGVIHWRTRSGSKYTLKSGRDGIVHNSQMYVAKLPGRKLISPKQFETGDKASKKHAWFSGSGNDFGCAADGKGRNFDLSIPGLSKLPGGSTVNLSFKSYWDIEWDYDYGYVLTSGDGGKSFTSHPSENGYTTSNTDPTAGNPNQNSCQAEYDNGLTGTSGSYQAGTEALDRKTGDTPKPIFLSDSYDVSDLAGTKTPVLRFSYATDPGLARPGWFIDDVKVTATTPSGKKVLFRSDFEKTGGPEDPHVFNGGCQADNPGGVCTLGWNYVKAGQPADFDHAYYLEMRDRSGFDLNGRGEIDRDPIGFQPGLYLAYTDEAHGYGNAGTDDPPAQSPLDANPEPGSATPNLNDASFVARKGRRGFSDFGKGHVDNYEDPSGQDKNGDGSTEWLFDYGCLTFRVLSMSGATNGPKRSNGDLTGTVRIRTGGGCGAFDYGY